jgi:hypothetical protein
LESFNKDFVIVDLFGKTPQEFKDFDRPFDVVEHPKHLPEHVQSY